MGNTTPEAIFRVYPIDDDKIRHNEPQGAFSIVSFYLGIIPGQK